MILYYQSNDEHDSVKKWNISFHVIVAVAHGIF